MQFRNLISVKAERARWSSFGLLGGLLESTGRCER